jgi:hypothetical protein
MGWTARVGWCDNRLKDKRRKGRKHKYKGDLIASPSLQAPVTRQYFLVLRLRTKKKKKRYPASNRNKYRKHRKKILGSKVRPVRVADNLTAIYEPIV